MVLLHVGTFQLDRDSHLSTIWHGLAPQIRLICSLLFVFATSFTANGRWWTWAIYGLGLAVLIILSRVTFSVLIRRVAIESAFMGTALLGTLFRGGDDILWQWGWLQVTTEGMTVLGSVSIKALLSLLMLNLLIMTTAIADLLKALILLKMPPLLVAIFNSMYRYLGVLIDELETMRRAALSRNLMNNHRWQRLMVGNIIGSLFIRTYERGERIHASMLARGYQGISAITENPPIKKVDRLVLVCLIALLSLGQGIYFF